MKKQKKVKALGGEVVAAVDSLLDDLETMGKSIGAAQKAYDDLHRRATEDKGRMSVRRVARNLLDYGVNPKGKVKQL